ncbi:hypothetical protein [Coleofasciculus sp. FACHB-1120]|nr:hypothetical protein [Coleofasciculus sp. FACHB-1120]MBD2741355.1 hypothetical protein [Coleofasciculus sp. FACHB-1120]
MSKKIPAPGFGTYLAEFVRILYWTYFKPYTFASWLRDIHPALKPDTNPL